MFIKNLNKTKQPIKDKKKIINKVYLSNYDNIKSCGTVLQIFQIYKHVFLFKAKLQHLV